MNLTIPLQGMQNSLAHFNAAATKITGATAAAEIAANGGPPDTVDLSAAMVAMMTSRNEYLASVNATKTESEMQQSLLNLLA